MNKGNHSHLPPASQLAEELREGASVNDLAKRYGCAVSSVYRTLNGAGYTGQGRVMKPAGKPAALKDDFAPPDFAIPEGYIVPCSTTDPEIFFPESGGSVRPAKRVCLGCEIRSECLTWALSQKANPWGVWGGLSEQERAKLRAKSQGDAA